MALELSFSTSHGKLVCLSLSNFKGHNDCLLFKCIYFYKSSFNNEMMSHILQATSFQSPCLERNSGKFSGDVESLHENDPQSKGNAFEVHEITDTLLTLKSYNVLVHVLWYRTYMICHYYFDLH